MFHFFSPSRLPRFAGSINFLSVVVTPPPPSPVPPFFQTTSDVPDIAIANFAITALGLLLAGLAIFMLIRLRRRRHRLVALIQRLVLEERRVTIVGIVETAIADAALMETYAYGPPPPDCEGDGEPSPHTCFATPGELTRTAVPDLLAAYEEVQARGAHAAEAYIEASEPDEGPAPHVARDWSLTARQARARSIALALPLAAGRESAFMQQDVLHSVALTRASLMDPRAALLAMLSRAEVAADVDGTDSAAGLRPFSAAAFRLGLRAHLEAHLGKQPGEWAAEQVEGRPVSADADARRAGPTAADAGAGGSGCLALMRGFRGGWGRGLAWPWSAIAPLPSPASQADPAARAPPVALTPLVAKLAPVSTAVESLTPRHREVAAKAAFFSEADEAQLDEIVEFALMSPLDASLAWITHRMGDKVKILFSFFQILVLLPSVYQTTWPAPFVSFLNVFSVLALDYWAIIPIDCAFPRTFYLGLYVVSLLPIAVIMLAWAVLLIVWAALPWRKRSAGGRLAGHSASLIDYGIKVSIYILFIVYPSVSRTTLSYFSCVPRGSVGADGASSLYVMQYAQATPCYDDAWYLNVVAAWIFIAVYPIGVVVLFALVLGERGGVGAQSPSSHRASLPT